MICTRYAGHVDSSIEHELELGADVQLVGELQLDAQVPIQIEVVVHRWRLDQQLARCSRTAQQNATGVIVPTVI